jgi:ATP-binding cassette subfamily B protein
LFGLIFVVLSNIFAIYPAQFVRESFDLLKNQLFDLKVGGYNRHHQIIKTVAWYGFLILVFALLKGLFMYLMRQSIIVMSRLIEGDLKDEIYDHYQQMDVTFYKRNKTGD